VTFTVPDADDAPTSSSTEPAKLKKKSSLKHAGKRKEGTSVSFVEVVTVRELPSEEADDAINTRKGIWEAAPEHDELWDGDQKAFWQEEKSVEEVRKIVVIRQMRMALQFNLGYAFYSMVANFKKRHTVVKAESRSPAASFADDIIPEYETAGAEETAIRKEIRELFADSVKGLDFPDLVQDREAFDKLYATTLLNISESKRSPGLGLLRIESLVDEIMNTDEICHTLALEYVKEEVPQKGKAERDVLEKIESAVGKEEKRRGNRRASIEAMNNGVSVFAERRGSVDSRRSGNSDSGRDDSDQPIFASSVRNQAFPPSYNGTSPKRAAQNDKADASVPQPEALNGPVQIKRRSSSSSSAVAEAPVLPGNKPKNRSTASALVTTVITFLLIVATVTALLKSDMGAAILTFLLPMFLFLIHAMFKASGK